MKRGPKKGRVLVGPQPLESRVINPLSFFNIVFQKFTHAHTDQNKAGTTEGRGERAGSLLGSGGHYPGFLSARLPRGWDRWKGVFTDNETSFLFQD